MPDRFPSLRNMLSGLAATSLATVSGLTLSTNRSRAFTHSSAVQTATDVEARLV